MLTPRLQEEIALLREDFPDAQIDDGGGWVNLPGHRLPLGRFNKTHTNIVFLLPPGYPNTGPDNFFVDSDLKLTDGTIAAGFNPGNQSGSGTCTLPGSWAWFSWHPQSWRSHAAVHKGDNLRTFVRTINACLRGEEQT